VKQYKKLLSTPIFTGKAFESRQVNRTLDNTDTQDLEKREWCHHEVEYVIQQLLGHESDRIVYESHRGREEFCSRA
jgi:hypothetical protein